MVDAHVDDTRRVRGDSGLAAGGSADESAPTDLPGDETPPRRFVVRAADGTDSDPQAIGEVPVGGQLRSRPEPRGRDVVGKGFRDREIPRESTPQSGLPHCHGDNVPIDT
jgi:hypothetical protein